MDTLSVLTGALLQDDGGDIIGVLFGGVGMICWFAVMILIIAGMWKTFTKAGKPGWASIIPFYNFYVMFEIVGRPGWWLLLLFVPFVNFVVYILLAIDMAKSFGKDALYGILLLWLIAPVGYLMLGFSDAEYQGPSVVS